MCNYKLFCSQNKNALILIIIVHFFIILMVISTVVVSQNKGISFWGSYTVIVKIFVQRNPYWSPMYLFFTIEKKIIHFKLERFAKQYGMQKLVTPASSCENQSVCYTVKCSSQAVFTSYLTFSDCLQNSVFSSALSLSLCFPLSLLSSLIFIVDRWHRGAPRT